jgi:excisionase family DNA binding protein
MATLGFRPPLTVAEAAAALNINRATIFELLKSGALRSVKIRAATRITCEEIERFHATLPAGEYTPLGPKQGVHPTAA